MITIPIKDYRFFNYQGPQHPDCTQDGMAELTCKNHPTARYLTKNPHQRSLHFTQFPEGMHAECDCPFSDLVVIIDDEEAQRITGDEYHCWR